MAKLRSFQEGMSSAINVPFARVRTVGAALRAARLLTTGPRGPGAPEMTPSDATNLLLGLMYDDEVANCAENVEKLRNARFVRSWRHDRGQFRQSGAELAPHHFLRDDDGEPLLLGAMLDALFDTWVRFGGVEDEVEEDCADFYASNLNLKVTRPGFHISFHIDALDTIWDLDYEWKSQEQLDYEAKADRNSPVWPAASVVSRMRSTREVDESSLWKIVDCLRGYEFPDDAEEISPVYDIGYDEVLEGATAEEQILEECI